MRYLALVLALTLAPLETALADSDSLLTLGVGTALGLTDTAESDPVATGELLAKLRILLGLGVELSYNPWNDSPRQGQLTYDSAFRLSGLLYIVPTTPVGGYLKVGVGSNDMRLLFDVTGETASYHGGGGLEIYLGKHVAIGGEFLFLVPGVHSVMAATGLAGDAQGQAGRSTSDVLSDAVAFQNYRAVLTLAYYL
jgi:hypothetical protein